MNMQTQEERYDEIFNTVCKVMAYPHTSITTLDKHRALVLISFLNSDHDMFEYLYSQLIEEDFKSIKHIRNAIYDKEITN